jgi:hypothetical protein
VPDAYRPLLAHALRFDWFEGGTQAGSQRLFTGALGGFFLSALLTSALAGAEPGPALAILFAFTAVAAFVSVLADVGSTLLDPRDVALLNTLPVSGASYFRARFTAFAGVLLHQTLVLAVIPAIVFASGGRGPWWGAGAYLLAAFLLVLFLAVVAILAFLFLHRLVDPTWIQDLVIWVQVLLFVVGTAGWLFLLRADRSVLAGFEATWLPSSWFASLYRSWVHGIAVPAASLTCLVASLGVLAAGLAWLSRRYLDILKSLRGGGRTRRLPQPPWQRAFARWWVRPEERAGFYLALTLLRRERTFRLQTYPLLAYPVLFLAFGRGHDDGGLFAILFSHFALLALPLAAEFLRYSDHSQAGWVYTLHNQQSGAALWSGARKALLLRTAAPLYAWITLLLIFDQGWVQGLVNGALAFVLATLVVTRVREEAEDLPFSCRFGGGLDFRAPKDEVFFLLVLVVVVGLLQTWLWSQAPWALPLLLAASLVFLARWLRRPVPTTAVAVAAVREEEPQESHPLPFALRLRREVRALGVLYAGGALLGLGLAWLL